MYTPPWVEIPGAPRRKALVDPLPSIRRFDTGATRDLPDGKADFEGFLSPYALGAFAAYMDRHRTQMDGSVRDSDNWQQGMPLPVFIKSAWRHLFAWWKLHRGGQVLDERDEHPVTMEEAICGLLFNAMGYLHEITKPAADPEGPDSCS